MTIHRFDDYHSIVPEAITAMEVLPGDTTYGPRLVIHYGSRTMIVWYDTLQEAVTAHKEVSEPLAHSQDEPLRDEAEAEAKLTLPHFGFITHGTFLMGSPEEEAFRNDDEVPHTVTISQPFWLADTVVTRQLWNQILPHHPLYTDKHLANAYPDYNDLPATGVSWVDAQRFISQLNERTDQNYRLPTEAEWEYACRAGTTTAYYFGDTLNPEQANFNSQRVRSVRAFPAGGNDLYQMHGNVWEWCQDYYAPYETAPEPEGVVDPTGPMSGQLRVLRGGSYNLDSSGVRSALRGTDKPDSRHPSIGFRLAHSLGLYS